MPQLFYSSATPALHVTMYVTSVHAAWVRHNPPSKLNTLSTNVAHLALSLDYRGRRPSIYLVDLFPSIHGAMLLHITTSLSCHDLLKHARQPSELTGIRCSQDVLERCASCRSSRESSRGHVQDKQGRLCRHL